MSFNDHTLNLEEHVFNRQRESWQQRKRKEKALNLALFQTRGKMDARPNLYFDSPAALFQFHTRSRPVVRLVSSEEWNWSPVSHHHLRIEQGRHLSLCGLSTVHLPIPTHMLQ